MPFSELYAQLLAQFAGQMGEGEGTYAPPARSVREEVVRCIWFGGHFDAARLRTDDGRRLEVLSPGWWNVEGGPDFVSAELILEGTGRLVGDVEVHTLSSGWYSHAHHLNPAYGQVALHVVMWNDRGQPTVEAPGGRQVPQLTLADYVERDLEELVEFVEPDQQQGPAEGSDAQAGWGWCARALADEQLDPQRLGQLLEAAGDHRLLERARTMAELFRHHSPDQVLYERLAEALGYRQNRMPFLQLAGLVPLKDLRSLVPPDSKPAERLQALEAVLFGAAGFLDQAEGADWDPEAVAYIGGLRERWSRTDLGRGPGRLKMDQWHFAGTRPVNYPPRRIAALAALCAQRLHEGLFNHFLTLALQAEAEGRQRSDTALRNALTEALSGLEHPFWSYRYRFGGRRLSRPRALVGQERATAILVDVLLPALLAHARTAPDDDLGERLFQVWAGLPRRPDNAVTRRMEQAMFPSECLARRVVHTARRQQGLHQLYRDFCSRRDCGRCVVRLAHLPGRNGAST